MHIADLVSHFISHNKQSTGELFSHVFFWFFFLLGLLWKFWLKKIVFIFYKYVERVFFIAIYICSIENTGFGK